MFRVIALGNVCIWSNNAVFDILTDFVDNDRFHQNRVGYRAVDDHAVVVNRSKRSDRTICNSNVVPYI